MIKGVGRCSNLTEHTFNESDECFVSVTVLMCVLIYTEGVSLSDLLDRAAQLSDKLHSLSTSLTNDLVSVCV